MSAVQRVGSSRGAIAGIALAGQVPTVLVETADGFEVARLEGEELTKHLGFPGTPTGAMVVLAGAVFLSSRDAAGGMALVSVELGAARVQTIATLEAPYLTATPRGELVFAQGDQLVLLSAHGLRALVELGGAGVEVEMDIDDRRRGRMHTRVVNPLSVVGRVAMSRGMAATEGGVVYVTAGDTISTDAVRFVSRIGGLPKVLFAIADQEDAERGTVSASLGPMAAHDARIAVACARTTLLGGRFGGELLVLDSKDGSVIERATMPAAAPTAIVCAGDRVVTARRRDDDEVIELWTLGGTAWKHVARRKGRGLAMTHGTLWYGDGDALVRVELGALSAGPSAKVAQLIELVKRAEGRYEKTSFQGKPAIKITSADGSRSIKPVTDAELEEIEAALHAAGRPD
jgi:hypothetical protein